MPIVKKCICLKDVKGVSGFLHFIPGRKYTYMTNTKTLGAETQTVFVFYCSDMYVEISSNIFYKSFKTSIVNY
jgi:hypothetical protein